ncbi:MAG: hypothetical protein ACPHJ3_13990 [Rubripirellula sp.]
MAVILIEAVVWATSRDGIFLRPLMAWRAERHYRGTLAAEGGGSLNGKSVVIYR